MPATLLRKGDMELGRSFHKKSDFIKKDIRVSLINSKIHFNESVNSHKAIKYSYSRMNTYFIYPYEMKTVIYHFIIILIIHYKQFKL